MEAARRRLRLSPHHHSGRPLAHHATSWWVLALLLAGCGAILIITTGQAFAGQLVQSGEISVSGKVPGPPPSRAAVILRPRAGDRFTANPVVVSGLCPADTLVTIYKNQTFAGSTPCLGNETFSLEIDLFRGQNVLIAKVFDDLDQAGPDSSPVTVYLDSPAGQSSYKVDDKGTTIPQLVLVTDPVYRGSFPDKERQIRPEVYGGIAPFALAFGWGDDKSQLLSRPAAGKFGITHTYDQPGTYVVRIRATDSQSQPDNAYVQTTVIINGPTIAGSGQAIGPGLRTLLLALWPLLAATAVLAGGFWLGEHYESYKLQQRLIHP